MNFIPYKPKRLIGGTVHHPSENLERVSEIWAKAGADAVMIRPAPDELDASFLERVSRVSRESQLRIVFHPSDEGSDNFSPSEPRLHDFMLERFKLVFERMNQEPDVYENLVIIHPPRTSHPALPIHGKRVLDERSAMRNAVPFYDRLETLASEFGVGVAIENIHAPFMNGRHAELGYTLSHLQDICGDRFGLCIDSAHAKLSWLGVGRLLDSGIPVLAAHVHGNHGSADEHLFPTKHNVGNVEDFERLLKQGIPLLIEARSDLIFQAARSDGFNEYVKGVITALRDGMIPEEPFKGFRC